MKPLLTYFTLAYLISWIIWLPLYGHIIGLNNLPTLPLHHALGGLGPLLAAFITTWLFGSRKEVFQLLKNCIKPTPILYLLIALLSPFILAIIALVASYFINQTPLNFTELFTNKEFPTLNLVTVFAYNLVFFGFGEEVGWRGFALARFQYKLNALTSSVVLAVFWAVWHWPLFFYRPGYTTMEMAEIFGWFFSLLTGSVLLTWLFNASKSSILICAVFHATIDIPFTANISNQNSMNYLGFLITLWGIITILVFKPKNLSFGQREKTY